jgi:bisphosphoglycerate-independent phosphoglycerate mutase (AlkP superfamily)
MGNSEVGHESGAGRIVSGFGQNKFIVAHDTFEKSKY